jgi:hypothetical protein
MATRRIQRRGPVRPQWVPPENNVAEVYRRNRSHLSAEERERLAFLAGDQDRDLFDAAEALESFDGGDSYVDEARAQLLSEDWMQGELDDLDNYVKAMRKGDRKDELEGILKCIRSVRDEAVQAMEYAAEQLDKLDEALGKLT